MISFFKKELLNVDKSIKDLVKQGFKFCLCILLFSTILLFTYQTSYSSPTLYTIGILIFRIGIIYLCTFIGCGFVFGEIKGHD